MELYTLMSVFFFFWQWRESALMYVDKYYIQPIIKKTLQENKETGSFKKLPTVFQRTIPNFLTLYF
jgi:hypothetical protein